MATHSSVLAWRIHMDRGAWRATDSQRVGHDRATKSPPLPRAHCDDPDPPTPRMTSVSCPTPPIESMVKVPEHCFCLLPDPGVSLRGIGGPSVWPPRVPNHLLNSRLSVDQLPSTKPTLQNTVYRNCLSFPQAFIECFQTQLAVQAFPRWVKQWPASHIQSAAVL